MLKMLQASAIIEISKSISQINLKSLWWWLHDPGLPGWNFNLSSREKFLPCDYMGNQISTQQGRSVFDQVFFYI